MNCRIQEIEEDSEAYYLAMEYALRPFTVTCDHCGFTETASQMDLEKRHWSLSKQGTFCRCSTVVKEPFEYAFGRAA